jgi:hypothetical protein
MVAEWDACLEPQHCAKVLLHLIARSDQVLVPDVQHPRVATAERGGRAHVSFPAWVVTVESLERWTGIPRIPFLPACDDIAWITQDIDDPYLTEVCQVREHVLRAVDLSFSDDPASGWVRNQVTEALLAVHNADAVECAH